METIIINCDGGSRNNPGPAACAFIVAKETGEEIFSQGKFLGIATNNIAEYTAVVEAINWLIENKKTSEKLIFKLDSQLVVNQLNGVYKVKEKNLQAFVTRIKNAERLFTEKITFAYVPREENKIADLLVNKTLDENI